MCDDASIAFQTFDSCVITDDIRKIADTELNERENEVQKSLLTFKELLQSDNELTPCLDDSFLIQFLRARKFDCNDAFLLIKKYYSAPVTLPKMFRNYSPRACLKVIDSKQHYFLPYRSPEGSAILLSKFGIWDPKTLTCEEILKFNVMCNEMAIQNPVTQICGIITIADMKGFSWSHMLQIPVSDLRSFVNTLQECLPVRDKAIHIVNNSSIFSILFSLVKPILNEKVKNRIFFHGDNYSSLHEHLPPAVLPESLGGELRDKPNEDFYMSLLNSEQDFIARRNYGYLSN